MEPLAPTEISCPVCATTGAPAAQIAAIAICGACGASLVVDATGIRPATAADTTRLDVEDLQQLRRARGPLARRGR